MYPKFVDNDNNPETEYLRTLVMEEFEEALNELPPEQKEALEMNEIQGIPFNEISKLTGTPVNTLISRKRYAVLFLRERLGMLKVKAFKIKVLKWLSFGREASLR